MKNLNVMFEDEEYNQLLGKKGERTWKEFFLLLLNWEEE